MKIALVHDQLHEFGGAERVLFALKKIFPDAPIYTAFVNKDKLIGQVPEAKNWEIRQSFVSHIPFIRRLYSPLRFLAPAIWESFDFKGFDVVISSSGWYMCKGINVKKDLSSRAVARDPKEISHFVRNDKQEKFKNDYAPIHISYIHHPPRYLYGYETAMEWQKYWPIKIYAHIINHFLRIWDFESSQRPDYILANSKETQTRISKFYRRESTVVYPPVNLPVEVRNGKWEGREYFVTVSRLQKAKHVEVLIGAANKAKFNLKIVGEGKDREYLESIAGPTVEFLGRIPDSKFAELYVGAKAFLFASKDEEFGIAPVEAMGYGVPVIAYKSGGLVETVKDGVSGFLFDELTSDSLIQTVNRLTVQSEAKYLQMCQAARTESEKYSEAVFRKKILEFVDKKVKSRSF